jgi:hypothetical protein
MFSLTLLSLRRLKYSFIFYDLRSTLLPFSAWNVGSYNALLREDIGVCPIYKGIYIHVLFYTFRG